MASTREQRERAGICGAKKKNGDICRAIAGTGTSHPGIGACKFHGGSTPSGNKAALRREVTQRMVRESTLGEPVEVSALDALLQELWASTGHVAWLRQQLADLSKDELSSPYGQAIVQLYNAERDRKGRVAKFCLEAGVSEAAIRVAEAQLMMLAQGLKNACEVIGMDEPTQRALGKALSTELSTLEAAPRALTA